MIVDEKAAVAGLSRAELATLKKILRRMYDNVSGHRPAGGTKPRVARRKPAR